MPDFNVPGECGPVPTLDDYEWSSDRQTFVRKGTKDKAPPWAITELERQRRQRLVAEKSARLDAIQQLFHAVPGRAEQLAILAYLKEMVGAP